MVSKELVDGILNLGTKVVGRVMHQLGSEVRFWKLSVRTSCRALSGFCVKTFVVLFINNTQLSTIKGDEYFQPYGKDDTECNYAVRSFLLYLCFPSALPKKRCVFMKWSSSFCPSVFFFE
jgi:hypothetical protein